MKEYWYQKSGGYSSEGPHPGRVLTSRQSVGLFLRIMVLHAQVEIHGIAKNTNYADS